MNDNVSVSVFLPTFCRFSSGHLERCILSVLNQSIEDFELLIVDDGSVDGTNKLIKYYASEDTRIIHLRNSKNTGLPALNTGLAYPKSKGKYLAFAFDDCELRPNHLETLFHTMENNLNIGMAYGKACSHKGNEVSSVVGMAYDNENMSIGNNHIPNVSVMIRREVVENVGWYDPNIILKRFCDWDLWVRIKKEYDICFIDKVLADEYGESLTNSLGNSFSLYSNFLDYAKIDRRKSLLPRFLPRYDPFNVYYKDELSKKDRKELFFILLEHFIKTNDIDRLISLSKKFSTIKLPELESLKHTECNSSDNVEYENIFLIRQIIEYYENRLKVLLNESNLNRNNFQKQINRNTELAKTCQEQEIQLVKHGNTIENLKNQNKKISTKLAARRNQCEILGQENRILSEKVSETENYLMRVFQSKSWKLTKPLRFVMEKFKNINNSKTDVLFNILAVSDALIPPVELGIILPFNYLSALKKVEYNFLSPQEVTIERIKKCDLLFCMRSCSNVSIGLLREARDMKKRVIYALDDDFENIDKDSDLGKHLKKINGWENVLKSCQIAHKVFVFSNGLFKKLESNARHIRIMPSLCNIELIDDLRRTIDLKYKKSTLVIGYAASHHHAANFEIAKMAVRKILEKFGDTLRFEIFFGNHLTGLEDLPNVIKLKPVHGNIREYYKTIIERHWDIGIAPLIDNSFNLSKSNNKYREYGALRIAGIYSNVEAFRSSIRNYKNGILSDNDFQSWYESLSYLVENSQKRLEIANNARLDVEQKYSMDSVTNEYLKEFYSITL